MPRAKAAPALQPVPDPPPRRRAPRKQAPRTEPDPRLAFTREQAARVLGVTSTIVDNLIEQGRLRSLKISSGPSGTRLIPRAEIERFLADEAS